MTVDAATATDAAKRATSIVQQFIFATTEATPKTQTKTHFQFFGGKNVMNVEDELNSVVMSDCGKGRNISYAFWGSPRHLWLENERETQEGRNGSQR